MRVRSDRKFVAERDVAAMRARRLADGVADVPLAVEQDVLHSAAGPATAPSCQALLAHGSRPGTMSAARRFLGTRRDERCSGLRAGPPCLLSPAAGRHDDIAHRFGHGQGVLASRHRGGNGVSLVLAGPDRPAAIPPISGGSGRVLLALPVTLRDSLAIVGPEARAVDTAGAAAPLKVIVGSAEVLVEALRARRPPGSSLT